MRRPQRLESAIERRVCERALDGLGVPNVKVIHPGGETGWPDRCFFIPGGRPFYIEFKRPGEEPTPKQCYIHDMLEELGYDIAWADDEEAAVQAIKARVDAAQLSKESGKVPPRTRRRRRAPT